MKLPSNTVFGCILASWTDGLFVHPDMTFQGDNGGGFATIPAGQYDVHPARGAVVCRPYDTTGGAVDWSAYTAYRATYSLLNPSSIAATYSSAVVTTEAQTVQEQDFGFAPFDPVTAQLNMTTAPANQYLVGDFLSLGTVGTRPKDANTGTGIWGDKTGLYGLSSATQEVIFSASTGKITAGAGAAVLDKDGVSVILDTTASSTRSFRLVKPDGTVTGRVSGYSATGIHSLELGALNIAAEDSVTVVYGDAPTAKIGSAALQSAKAGVITGELGVIDDASNNNYAYLSGNQGIHIGEKSAPVSLVHVGTGTGTGVLAQSVNVRGDGATGDYLVGAFLGNWTGTSGDSIQGVEGYCETNHASGTLTRALGVIAHNDHIGAGTVTDSKAFVASTLLRNGCGAVTNAFIFKSDGLVRLGTPGTVTNGYGLYLDAMPVAGVTNRYGVYQAGAGDQNLFAGSVTVQSAFTSPGIDDNADAIAITIDSSERVGIGSTSPDVKLDIEGNSAVAIRLTDTNVANASWDIRAQTGNTTKLFRVIDVSASADRLTINDTGDILGSARLFIGDTAESDVTVGLVLNQGGSDDYILTLKSSDVAQLVTDEAEADTYGAIRKVNAAAGGLEIRGFKDNDGGGTAGNAVRLRGFLSTAANTTHTAAGAAVVDISASVKDGANGATTVAANGNLVSFSNHNTVKFLFDGDGDAFSVGATWTAFDSYNDIALLNTINDVMLRAKDPIKADFLAWVSNNAPYLQDLKLVSFGDTGLFINRTKMQELLVGAVRQMGERLATLEKKLGG
jgi:hypothetical protein